FVVPSSVPVRFSFSSTALRPLASSLFPYTTLFGSCSVILHGSPPSAGNTWICGRSSSSGRRKAIHRPSGEWTAPLSRSPRVNLTGWSEPSVGTDQRELEQASLSRSGRASTNTTRFPSGDSVGALMLFRWLIFVGFLHGLPQGAGRPVASSLSLGSDPSGDALCPVPAAFCPVLHGIGAPFGHNRDIPGHG